MRKRGYSVSRFKSELDDALNILASHSSEIASLKNKNDSSFEKCNEERLHYMNECLKLQKILQNQEKAK